MWLNVFGSDMYYGGFRLSDFGLMLSTFSLEDEEELGMDYEVIEEFVGHNPVPMYLGSEYTNKLELTTTIIKSQCGRRNYDAMFTEHECREVLRQLTGFRGYRDVQIIAGDASMDELYHFRARTRSVSYLKYGDGVVGIILNMECDSQFAWSPEHEYKYEMKAGTVYTLINMSDDLYNYLLPTVIITTPTAINSWTFTNLTDDNWESTIKNIKANEVITMDSGRSMLTTSTPDRYMINDFNMHFIRLVAGLNQFKTDHDCSLTFRYSLPRKVGVV